jgi:(2Fe-2S) ferredoxin
MCYPHGVWFQAVGETDIPEIEAKVRELLGN